MQDNEIDGSFNTIEHPDQDAAPLVRLDSTARVVATDPRYLESCEALAIASFRFAVPTDGGRTDWYVAIADSPGVSSANGVLTMEAKGRVTTLPECSDRLLQHHAIVELTRNNAGWRERPED